MVMTSCPPILLLLQCWVESQGRGYVELSTNPLVVTVLGGVTGAWLCRAVHQSSCCYSAGWSHRGVVMTSCPPILLLLQCWVESQGRGYDELSTNPLVVTVLGGVTGAWLCQAVHQSSCCYSAGWSHRGVVMTSCPPILLLLQCWVESQGRGYDELSTNPLVVTVLGGVTGAWL